MSLSTLFIKGLGVKHVTAGFDLFVWFKRCRYDGRYGQTFRWRFGTTIVGKVTDNDEKISSTRIRQLLSDRKC